jgi:hypothetical protein
MQLQLLNEMAPMLDPLLFGVAGAGAIPFAFLLLGYERLGW